MAHPVGCCLSSLVECGKQSGREAGASGAECLGRAGRVYEGAETLLTHICISHPPFEVC